MVYEFTCPTTGCENNETPVYLIDPTNPVECGLCHAFGDAVLMEPQPEPLEPTE